MVELKKDGKSVTWVLTKTDSEGYHKQMNLTRDELNELTRIWHILSCM